MSSIIKQPTQAWISASYDAHHPSHVSDWTADAQFRITSPFQAINDDTAAHQNRSRHKNGHKVVSQSLFHCKRRIYRNRSSTVDVKLPSNSIKILQKHFWNEEKVS